MHFSATTTHGLRVLALLAGRADGAPLQRHALARRLRLPPDYLAKVLAALTRAGVLTATPGARGGYRLARPASRIPLAQAVLPLEGSRGRPGCVLRPGRPCTESAACSAHPHWGAVKRAYEEFLQRTTVADIRG